MHKSPFFLSFLFFDRTAGLIHAAQQRIDPGSATAITSICDGSLNVHWTIWASLQTWSGSTSAARAAGNA
jgi:hypothetical protein